MVSAGVLAHALIQPCPEPERVTLKSQDKELYVPDSSSQKSHLRACYSLQVYSGNGAWGVHWAPTIGTGSVAAALGVPSEG